MSWWHQFKWNAIQHWYVQYQVRQQQRWKHLVSMQYHLFYQKEKVDEKIIWVEWEVSHTLFTVETSINETNFNFTFGTFNYSSLLTDWIGAWNTIDCVRIKLSWINSSNIDCFIVFVQWSTSFNTTGWILWTKSSFIVVGSLTLEFTFKRSCFIVAWRSLECTIDTNWSTTNTNKYFQDCWISIKYDYIYVLSVSCTAEIRTTCCGTTVTVRRYTTVSSCSSTTISRKYII